MKKLTYLILALALVSMGAAPTRQTSYTSGTTIRSDDVTGNEDEIFGYLQTGVDTLRADAVDSMTEIKSSLRSGSDTLLITGSEGTDGTCAEWNADGDLVEAASATACGSTSELSDLSDVGTSTGTAGNLLVADGSDFNAKAMSGDCTIASTGVITCAGGAGDLLANGTVPLTADWNAGNSLYDITAVEFKGALIGNSDTSTAAASEPSNCSAGSYPLGVDTSWDVESCTDATTEINSVVNGLGGTNLTCATQNCNVDDAFLVNDANDETSGVITSTGFTIGAAVIIESELETIDGVTAGTAAADKAVVLDSSLDIATINSLTATTLVGALTGNSDTATALATARTIAGVSFDGTANIDISLDGLSDVGTSTSTAGNVLIGQGNGVFDSKALSGDITTTGAGAVTIADDAIKESKMNMTNGPTDNYILSYNAGSPEFTWVPDANTGALVLDDLTDVGTSTSTAGNLLVGQGNGVFDAKAMGGRSVTIDSDSIDADAELYTLTKCAAIETPTDADNFLIYHVELGAQVTAIHCIVEAATSATVDLEQCDVAGDNCTDIVADAIVCDVGGQADDGTIDNPDLDVDDWVRANVTATSGTPGHVTVCFTMEMDD